MSGIEHCVFWMQGKRLPIHLAPTTHAIHLHGCRVCGNVTARAWPVARRALRCWASAKGDATCARLRFRESCGTQWRVCCGKDGFLPFKRASKERHGKHPTNTSLFERPRIRASLRTHRGYCALLLSHHCFATHHGPAHHTTAHKNGGRIIKK